MVLAALALIALLSSCSYKITSDPLLAAQVNGDPITLTAFQAVLPVYLASYEVSAEANATTAAPVPLVDWRLPSQRATYTQIQQTALGFLINLTIQQEILREQHITVPAQALRDAQSQINSVIVARKQQLAQNPTDAALNALIQALTPNAIQIFAEQGADQMTFAQHGKLPQAHIYEIDVKTRQLAEQLQTQAQHGASFTALARKYSTSSTAKTNGGEQRRIYVGQLSDESQARGFADGGVGLAFDQAIFAPAETPTYAILPLPSNGGYGLFSIAKRAMAPIATLHNTTTEQGLISNWIAGNLYTAATIKRYVAIG